MSEKSKASTGGMASEPTIIQLSPADAKRLDDIQEALNQVIDMMKRAENRRRVLAIC